MTYVVYLRKKTNRFMKQVLYIIFGLLISLKAANAQEVKNKENVTYLRFYQNYAIAIKNDKWGVVDRNFNFVIPPKYEKVSAFVIDSDFPIAIMNGFTWVKKNDKWAAITDKNELITAFMYDAGGEFYNGQANVKINGKHGVINTHGAEIIPIEYDYPISVYADYYIVCKNGKYGYLDAKGKLMLPLQYDSAAGFTDGKAQVKKDNKYYLIDKKGNCVAGCK